MHALPTPSADANQHSQALIREIQQAIVAAGGYLPFDQYMRMALYQPGLGYYSAGSKKFGAAGDFVTAPELSDYFGACCAQPMQQLFSHPTWQHAPAILELGAGQAKLAKQILLSLQQANVAVQQYCILEVSAQLRQAQQQYLASALPADLFDCVHWLDTLPSNWQGVIIANEVFDALPIQLHRLTQQGAVELGVALDQQGNLQWAERPAVSQQWQALAQQFALSEGYLMETCPAAQGLLASLAECLHSGLILLIDYGFDAASYYHAQRRQGTLMCHYRHYAHSDPLLYPGLQDITAHVNFTALAECGLANHLQLVGYVSQAQFLLNCGVLQQLAALAPNSPAYWRASSQINTLLSPAEMGDLFKVIAFDKQVAINDYVGFQQGEQSFRL